MIDALWIAVVLLAVNVAALVWSVNRTDRKVAKLQKYAERLDGYDTDCREYQESLAARLDRVEKWASDHVPAKFALDPDESYDTN